jgi:eukaryotic-like serine/threonine-protein kinase
MKRKPIRIGTQLSPHFSVAGIVDGESVNPVYLLWDARDWCPKACKLFDSDQAAKHEADLLAAFDHPNIARCFGNEKPGLMLMEFLEGPTLSHFISAQKNHRLSVGNAMRIAIYIGSALIHMHRKGFLHLDVKASNIIIYRSRPVLIDVGTARKISAGKPAGIIGTDTYMSPEQCLREKLTPASDVFALGVLLFRMLSGEFPFVQKRGGKHFAQVSQPPLPLRTLRSSIPLGLEKLVYSCLTLDPAQRPTLEKLLPQLHCFITTGAAMWPEQINQRQNAKRKNNVP